MRPPADHVHHWEARPHNFGPNGPRDRHYHTCTNLLCTKLLEGAGLREECRAGAHWLQGDRERKPVVL